MLEKVDFEKAYRGSYYTILGCGGDIKEWTDGYEKLLKENGIGTPTRWYICNGKDINRKFRLTGDNAFKNDLTCLFFPIQNLNVGKLAIFKLRMGDRWFDDIIDNTLRRQEGEE